MSDTYYQHGDDQTAEHFTLEPNPHYQNVMRLLEDAIPILRREVEETGDYQEDLMILEFLYEQSQRGQVLNEEHIQFWINYAANQERLRDDLEMQVLMLKQQLLELTTPEKIGKAS